LFSSSDSIGVYRLFKSFKSRTDWKLRNHKTPVKSVSNQSIKAKSQVGSNRGNSIIAQRLHLTLIADQ